MDYNHHHNNHHRNGGGIGEQPSFSNTSSSSDLNHSPSSNSVSNHKHEVMNSDPVHSWWESVSKARTRIQTLISLLPSSDPNLSTLIDSDRPARSLLDSFSAYSAVSASIIGSGDDPLCQWLYDTFQQSEDSGSDLRLVVMSFIPLLAGLYLTRIHASSTTTPSPGSPSLAGFEAVLLALYSSQSKSRAGKPILVSVPTPAYLAQHSSLYHQSSASSSSPPSKTPTPLPVPNAGIGVGVMCAPLEPQVGIKSTKRALIIGVAFQCFYTHISMMPSWSKIEVCRFATSWAGHDCPCSISQFSQFDDDVDVYVDEVKVDVEEKQEGVRIPLAWEVLQPMLRILAHCLLAPSPLISDDIKEAAAVAVRRLHARASHDLSPQAILATRGLVQLHDRAIVAAKSAVLATASSNATTPTSVKKQPEMLLVSK